MQNYVKVINNEVIEVFRNKERKPIGTFWKELEANKPNYNKETEVLLFDYYEILEDKVIEHFKIEPINFEPMPVEEDE